MFSSSRSSVRYLKARRISFSRRPSFLSVFFNAASSASVISFCIFVKTKNPCLPFGVEDPNRQTRAGKSLFTQSLYSLVFWPRKYRGKLFHISKRGRYFFSFQTISDLSVCLLIPFLFGEFKLIHVFHELVKGGAVHFVNVPHQIN